MNHPVGVVREIYEQALAEAEKKLFAMEAVSLLHQRTGFDCPSRKRDDDDLWDD